MGKFFDALCFFLVLLAAAPRFSRGLGHCCTGLKYCSSTRECGASYCNSVMECIISGSTTLIVTRNCDFGVPPPDFEIRSDITVKGAPTSWLRRAIFDLTFHGNVNVLVGSISFTNLELVAGNNGKSTINIFSYNPRKSHSFENCVFEHGVNMVFKRLVHVVVKRTHFNMDSEGPTMLDIERGSIEFSGDDNIVRCTNSCNQSPIKMNICSNTTIQGVVLEESAATGFPVFDFYPCKQAMESVPTLKIENVKFHGRPKTIGTGWMIVRGDKVKGPRVVLNNNDYDGLADNVQIGSVFRFFGTVPQGISDVKSHFTLSRSSSRSTPSGWSDEMNLATTTCSFDGHNEMHDVYLYQTLPIGPTKDDVRQYDLSCASYCCYVENYPGKKAHFDTSIAACLKHTGGLEPILHVTDDCPFGKPESPISSVQIAKAATFKGDTVKITFEGGDYPFVNAKAHPVVFKNIHFKSSSGVVKILLGREVATGVNAPVEMIGCVVDINVVVKLQHDVHFTATDKTTFVQGYSESVFSLVVGDVNQVVQLSGSRFLSNACHTIITGPLCGTVAMEDSIIYIILDSGCGKAFVDLTECTESSSVAPKVLMERLTFRETSENTDVPWIKLEFSAASSAAARAVVALVSNDYTGANAEKETMFEITQRMNTEHHARVSSRTNMSSSDNTDLATVWCMGGKAPTGYKYAHWARGNYTMLPASQTSSGLLCQYCCGVLRAGLGIALGRSIGECVTIGNGISRGSGSQTEVHVLSVNGGCPYGEEHPIVFKNIHFKKALGAGDGVVTILLGREVATGVNAPVEMVGCVVDTDVVVKLQHDVHFTATNTTFNQGSTESVLSLVSDVNQDVKLSGCVLSDTVCHTMITGPMCGKVTITNGGLRKVTETSCTKAAVDLTICNTDVDEVPNLEIEGITFEGEVANEGDAAWIKVEGSIEKVTEVTLINNDYRGLNDKELTQKGRIYRFHQVSLTRRVTVRNLQTSWDANTPLATHICPSNNNAPVLPIGGGLTGRRRFHQECSGLCCALKTPEDGKSGVRFQGSSISECLQNLRGNTTRTIVEVFAKCPLGDTIPVGKAEVVKSETYAGDVEEALITGKSKEEYSLAGSNGITFNNNIRYKTVWNAIAPPKIAVDSSEVGTDCACIQGFSEACYSSLWEAFDGLDQYQNKIKTIRIEGVCISSRNGSVRELWGDVKIMKKRNTRGPTVVLFRSVAQLRVMENLYIGPGIVLQTPEKFDMSDRARLRHVRIYVGRRSVKGEQMALLELFQARVHGCIEILVEEAGRLKAIETRFSGKPRISTSDRANKVTNTVRGNLPPAINLIRSTFTREFEVRNPIESMIGIGCAIGTNVNMRWCSFPNSTIGAAVDYCYCAGNLTIQYSSFGIAKTADYSLVNVNACDKQTALEHHRGGVLLDGISFTDAENSEVASPRLGAITLDLYPAGPNVKVKDIDYRGFQGRDGLVAVDSKPIFITMYSGYDGRLSNVVKKNYGDMSYEKKDFGGSLKCVVAQGNAMVTPILPILRKEEHNEVLYRCNDEGTVLANDVVLQGGRTVDTTPGVHEDNLDDGDHQDD